MVPGKRGGRGCAAFLLCHPERVGDPTFFRAPHSRRRAALNKLQKVLYHPEIKVLDNIKGRVPIHYYQLVVQLYLFIFCPGGLCPNLASDP